jgi:Ca2+/Na+ antiporter
MALAAFLRDWEVSPGTALLALAAVTLYVASRAAADALAGGDPGRPGARAFGHCLPIAITALLCLHPLMARPGLDPAGGRPQIAVGILFASSVACLTLVLGVVTYIAPLTVLPTSRKAWPFILPTALLALIAGFNGSLNWLHASMLALLGVAVMNLWVDRGPERAPYPADVSESEHTPRRASWARWLQLGLAIVLSGVGAWGAARGVAEVEQRSRILTGVLLAGTVVGPLLTLPVLGSTAAVAERGRSDSAVSTLIAIVLINLCAILPLVILAHHVLTAFAAPPATASQAATLPTTLPERLRAVPYPMISWRVDTVVLVVIGFALIPWAIGRWTSARAESVALVFGYAIYLALNAILSTRWR